MAAGGTFDELYGADVLYKSGVAPCLTSFPLPEFFLFVS